MGIMQHLVCTCLGEGCVCNTDLLVCSIEYDVEPFDPGHTVDEVETRARITANIADDKEDMLVVSANRRVQSPGPDLSVCGKLEGDATDDEEQALEVNKLGQSQ